MILPFSNFLPQKSVLPLKIRNNYYQPINYIVIVFTCTLYRYQSIQGVLIGTNITFAYTPYKHVIDHNVNYFISTLHYFISFPISSKFALLISPKLFYILFIKMIAVYLSSNTWSI